MRKALSSQIIEVTQVIVENPWHIEVHGVVRRFELSDWMLVS